MFKIIDKLGGEEAFLRLVAENAVRSGKRPPSKHAVKAWKYQGQLPNHIIAMAAGECLARGIIFDPADCEDAAKKASRRPFRGDEIEAQEAAQ